MVTADIIMMVTNSAEVCMVERNIIFNKAGGTAGKNSINYKINLPAEMVRTIGVTPEDRGVLVSCVDGKIIIEKKHD